MINLYALLNPSQ